MTRSTTFAQKVLLVIFGFSLLFILLESGLRLGGWMVLLAQERFNVEEVQGKKVQRIVCLGESTTLLGGASSYPRQLEKILNSQSKNVKFKVINRGMPAKNSSWILLQALRNLSKDRPDLVLTMIGINDTIGTLAYEETFKVRMKMFFENLRILRLVKLTFLHTRQKIFEIRSTMATGIKPEYQGSNNLIVSNLLEEIRMHPREHWAYEELAKYYKEQSEFDKVRHLFRQGIIANPRKSWGYEMLGNFLAEQGFKAQAERVFLEAIDNNPKKAWAYTYAGRFYRDDKRYDRAQAILKEAAKQDPRQRETYLELGILLRQLGRYREALPVLDQAVTVTAGKGRGLLEKGFCLYALGQREEAGDVFSKAVSEDHRLYQNLVEWFFQREEYLEIENFLLAEKKKFPEKLEIDSNLVLLYEQWGKEDLARKYYNGVRSKKKTAYYEGTAKNYTRLVDRIRSMDIPVIAVQYPVRSVAPLKELLQQHEVLDFVDNEKTFKEALEQGNFRDYFEDSFAGDFGHCSQKGNALLAKNIAAVVLKHFDR